MKYSVYQIQYSQTDIDEINAELPNAKRTAKMEMDFDFSGDKIGGLADKALDAGLYTHVSNIEADNPNQVFEIGNIGPESAITRFSRMHSLSVGDIIVDEEGQVIVVAPIGFVAFAFRPKMNIVAEVA